MPGEPRSCLRGVQFEIRRFVRMHMKAVRERDMAITPYPDKSPREIENRHFGGRIGTEVPCIRVLNAFTNQLLAEQKVSCKRLQNVLPRPDSVRAAQDDWLASL